MIKFAAVGIAPNRAQFQQQVLERRIFFAAMSEMEDDEREGDVIPTHGSDWEVVSLTASTYAASPDPKGCDPDDDGDGSKQESSRAMFTSGHSVFPPSKHENLPIEPDHSEIHNVSGGKTVIPAEEEGTEHGEDKLEDDDSQGTEFFDNGNSSSACGVEFEEGKGLQMFGSISYAESTEPVNPGDSSNQDPNSPHKEKKSSEGNNDDESGQPCAAWWKKHAKSLYCHMKEANTFWSIVVAAALTGFVILGKRWHRDKWHAQELRRHLTINDEKMKGAVGPIGRIKNIIIGSH